MDVPHSLLKCNFSAGTILVNVYVQPCPWSLTKIFGYSVVGLLLYAVQLGGIGNINKKYPGAPASYYFCQSEILYSERVNGLLSKNFISFTVICSLYSLWGRKSFHLAIVKLCTSCSQTADRKVWSLKSEMKFHFCWGVKTVFFNWYEWTLPSHATNSLFSFLFK